MTSARSRRSAMCRQEHVCLGDPQGTPRSAAHFDAARSGADLEHRRGRGARPCDGGRRQLQRRVGRPRHPDFADRRPQKSLSHRRLRRVRHRLGGRHQGQRWKVGDEVVVHCNQDDGDDEECNGGDPMFSPSQRIWGYETPDGSFAQFCRVQARQLMTKPKHLTWEEAACYTLTLATTYRMLFGHPPAHSAPGDNVLVWGASGGLGVVRRAALRGVRRQRHRRHLRRDQARIRARSRRQGRHQPQGFQLLGPDAQGRHARIRCVVERGAQIRQGDLGHHRQGQRRRHGVRASGRSRPSRCRASW